MFSPEDYTLIWKAMSMFQSFVIIVLVIADYLED